MTDIVERLREWKNSTLFNAVDLDPSDMDEAASEIEQLRRDKQLGFELMDVFIKQINQLKKEVARAALYDEGPRREEE